jgi:hypothetical protein
VGAVVCVLCLRLVCFEGFRSGRSTVCGEQLAGDPALCLAIDHDAVVVSLPGLSASAFPGFGERGYLAEYAGDLPQMLGVSLAASLALYERELLIGDGDHALAQSFEYVVGAVQGGPPGRAAAPAPLARYIACEGVRVRVEWARLATVAGE